MAVKTLNTLIKIHKQKTDFLRREMIALEEEQLQLQKLAEKLKREYEQESKLASESPELARFFGAYSAHVKNKIASIGEENKRLNTAIEEKRNAIGEEYSEQKKYEIALDNMKRQITEQEKHRLQTRFDEVGNQQYIRHKENPL